MAPEERAAFQKQFELGEDGKKLTPAEADQKKLNYMMEEVEAESFRYLMSNTTPQTDSSRQQISSPEVY